jgi:hypothetical protein
MEDFAGASGEIAVRTEKLGQRHDVHPLPPRHVPKVRANGPHLSGIWSEPRQKRGSGRRTDGNRHVRSLELDRLNMVGRSPGRKSAHIVSDFTTNMRERKR